MTEAMGDADPLYREARFARFYDLENGWTADLAWCAGLARDAGSVLDLGCGTGLFLTGIEGPARRVGVDPAAAMLAIARARPGGDRAAWIEADARTVRLGETFDLVVLTGHAFQMFLTDADQRAVLATIAAHLAPGGRFVFDSREPAAREWLEWSPDDVRRFTDPELGPVEAWNEARHDAATGIVTYLTHYRLADGELFTATSRIRFSDRPHLARQLAAAGLAVDTWLGAWTGTPHGPGAKEIIPVGRGG